MTLKNKRINKVKGQMKEEKKGGWKNELSCIICMYQLHTRNANNVYYKLAPKKGNQDWGRCKRRKRMGIRKEIKIHYAHITTPQEM